MQNHLASPQSTSSSNGLELYHYTSRSRIEPILTDGLCRGELALSPRKMKSVVWLTTDLDPSEHGLGEARPLTTQEKITMGLPLSEDASWSDKREVRLTIKIPEGDSKLRSWASIAWRMSPSWRASLVRTGGGAAKAKTWFVYDGVIPVEWISRIDELKPSGDLEPLQSENQFAMG